MATRIVAPGGAKTHPQRAGTAPREPNIAACALSRGKVCLMQFAARSDSPDYVSVLSPAGAEALAKQLIAAASIAQEARGAA